jgi:hypothetical protein
MKLTEKEKKLISKFIDINSPVVSYIYNSGYCEGLKDAYNIYYTNNYRNDSMENEYRLSGANIKKASNDINLESEIL